MFPAAAVAVAARADLVVEGAVDFVLLRAEDGGEEVGHFDGGVFVLIVFFFFPFLSFFFFRID